MRAFAAALLACAAGGASAAVTPDGAADAPLMLRFSERLSPLGPVPAPAGARPSATTPEAATALPPPPPARRSRMRRKLTLDASLAGWSGTRRNDGADGVAVPRAGLDASASLPAGYGLAVLADVAREQAGTASASRTRAQLREAWVGWKQATTSARVGWQIVNWGRTDVLNPTDNVAARDYTRTVDRDSDQKLGLPMLNVQQRFGTATTLQALWLPRFRASQVPLPPVAGARYRADRPGWTPGAAGLRLDHSGERLSGSLSYLRGPTRLPNLALTVAAFSAGELPLDHPVADTVGIDGEAVFGAWVLRGESAWTRVRSSGRAALSSRESALDSVLGVERAFGSSSLFVQAEWKYIPHWIDPASTPEPVQALARANASFNDERHRHRAQLGAGYALNTPDLRWSLSFDGAWAPADGDWVLRPRLRYRLDDRCQLFAGGDWFRGPTLGVYGRLRPASAVFAGLTVSVAPAWLGR